MEDHIKRFLDLLDDCKIDLENQIYTNMFINALDENDKEKTLRVIATFNKHGVSTKVLGEVCVELVKEGVFN